MSEIREDFFAPVRGSLAGIAGLSVLGAVAGVVPFIAVVELARTLLPALDGDDIDHRRAWTIVAVTVVALCAGFAAAFASGLVGHLADAELQLSLRR
jgi:ATP-binding cassette subfamily B protein